MYFAVKGQGAQFSRHFGNFVRESGEVQSGIDSSDVRRLTDWIGNSPTRHRSLSGPSGPKCPRSVPKSVPENRGCPRECPTGCLQGPSGPGLRSVRKVSRECALEFQKGVPDTPGTLSGYFLDTPEPGARRALQTPRRTLPRTPPVFWDTLGDTPGTLRARRARETPVPGRRVPNYWTLLNVIQEPSKGGFSKSDKHTRTAKFDPTSGPTKTPTRAPSPRECPRGCPPECPRTFTSLF